MAYNEIYPTDPQGSGKAGLHSFFKSNVPVYSCNRSTHDNERTKRIFHSPIKSRL